MTDIVSGAAPHDLIAYSWFVLGFRPRESLLAVGLAGERLRCGTVVRIDVPPDRDAARAGVTLADTLERAGEDACVLFTVTDRGGPGPLLDADGGMPLDGLSCTVAATLRASGVEILDAVVVGPEHYRSYLCRDGLCCPAQGRPLADVRRSEVAAAMVLEGRCVADDESGLVADVDPVAAAARGETVLAPRRARPGAAQRRAVFDRWCADLDAGAEEPSQPAALLAALSAVEVRDAVLATLLPGAREAAGRLLDDAGGHQPWPEPVDRPDPELARRGERLLACLARRAPSGLRAAPLAALAWLAWWSGDGVRARLLVERALDDDPGHRLAAIVDALLEHGVAPPWQETELAERLAGPLPVAAPGG